MKNIPIELFENPSVQHFDEDLYIIVTKFGLLGGATTLDRANAIVDWLNGVVSTFKKIEWHSGMYNHPIDGLNNPEPGGISPPENSLEFSKITLSKKNKKTIF